MIEKLVYDSIAIKSSIVNRDEKEKGERRKLNFGHTFGHPFEKTARLSHGEAVSVGMAFASELSRRKNYLGGEEVKRIRRLLKAFRLPVEIPMDREEVFDALRRDKKRDGDHVHFVLLKEIGKAFVEPIPLAELEAVINAW